MRFAVFNVTGTNVSQSLMRRRKLALPDLFREPIEDLVAQFSSPQEEELDYPLSRATLRRNNALSLIRSVKLPWATIAICLLLSGSFLAEGIMALSLAPGMRLDAPALATLGGLNRELVLGGEWYRLITAPMLHASIEHLLFNCVGLLFIGFIVEKWAGSAWLSALFIIGMLGGAIGSLLANPPEAISVGASGAILGLLAAAFVSSFRFDRYTRARARIQLRCVQLLVPSLLPISLASGQVDYAAHFSGALSAGVVAWLLLRTTKWPGLCTHAKFPPVSLLAP